MIFKHPTVADVRVRVDLLKRPCDLQSGSSGQAEVGSGQQAHQEGSFSQGQNHTKFCAIRCQSRIR
jgi:hypothetical protein